MKVLYILGNVINRAGVERIMINKINYLADTGYDVSLITTDQDNQPFSFSLSESVNYVPIKAPIPSRADHSYSFIKWLFHFYKSRTVYKRKLHDSLISIKPDIAICTTYSFDVLDILTEVSHKCGIKFVVESHIQRHNVFMEPRMAYNSILSLYGKIHDLYILKHLRRTDKLVCLTDKDMASWKQYHIENVCVVPNMITIQPPIEIDYSAKRVIAAGRYSHQKGFDILIKAWGRISPKHHDWHLYIFGNEDRTPYEQLAKMENCQETCHCMPATEDISAEYSKSSIFVMSSRYEGMPLALIEAMSSGLACISFNCPNGPSDIINDCTDGILVKNGDINDLISKMEELICNESLRNRIGVMAKHNIERYSPNSVMQQNISLYKNLLNQE